MLFIYITRDVDVGGSVKFSSDFSILNDLKKEKSNYNTHDISSQDNYDQLSLVSMFLFSRLL